jgi:copper homeostasis protein
MCRDPGLALEQLVQLGVDRILTSGQESSCLEGIDLIAALHRRAAGRIVIMPGGGLTPRNVRKIVQATGVAEVHLSARKTVESAMQFRNPNCFMGGTLRPPEFATKTTDETAVRAVVASLAGNRHPPAAP